MSECNISEFKGNKVIEIPLEGDYKFSFGKKKAEAILEHIEEIKDFVNNIEGVKDEWRK